jgi:hypothetical protein
MFFITAKKFNLRFILPHSDVLLLPSSSMTASSSAQIFPLCTVLFLIYGKDKFSASLTE